MIILYTIYLMTVGPNSAGLYSHPRCARSDASGRFS